MKKLFIATPCYGGKLEADFAIALIQTFTRISGQHRLHLVKNDSLITRARNNCVAAFLRTDCTHLLFVDSDIIFTPEDIEMLCEHDKAIVCGLYPKKQKELEWVINKLDNDEHLIEGHLQRVKYAGTGMMLISRDCIQSVIKFNPQLAYRADPDEGAHDCWDIFGDPVIDGRKLSEDWFFCHLCAQAGYFIWVDRRVWVKHIGKIEYPIDKPPQEPQSEMVDRLRSNRAR